jgi:hypothetical protein
MVINLPIKIDTLTDQELKIWLNPHTTNTVNVGNVFYTNRGCFACQWSKTHIGFMNGDSFCGEYEYAAD